MQSQSLSFTFPDLPKTKSLSSSRRQNPIRVERNKREVRNKKRLDLSDHSILYLKERSEIEERSNIKERLDIKQRSGKMQKKGICDNKCTYNIHDDI